MSLPRLRGVKANTLQTPETLPMERPSAKVYAEFYAKYNSAAITAREGLGRAKPIIDGRVLHSDDPFDRSMHLFVYDTGTGNIPRVMPRRDAGGNQYSHFSYESDGFMVIMTDGIAVQEWRISQVDGKHWGSIDGVVNPYRQGREELSFYLVDEDNSRAQLDVSRVGAGGIMRFGDGAIVWVLDDWTSRAEQQRALVFPEVAAGAITLAS